MAPPGLPLPDLSGSNPWAAFAATLDQVVHMHVKGNHQARSIVLMVFLAYSVVISLVHLVGYCVLAKREHRPIWFAHFVKRPQGRYITLNQCTIWSSTNLVLSVLWLMYLAYLYKLWSPNSTMPGRLFLYFLNMLVATAYIPLALITYLLISAGNLTSKRQHSDKHQLAPCTVNSLLLAVFPAIWILLFVPGIIAGRRWQQFVTAALGVLRDAEQQAAAFPASPSETERSNAASQITAILADRLDPHRAAAIEMQHKARICQLPPLVILLAINLLGYAFLLRHLRQDRAGQLVFRGRALVAPLTAHRISISSSSSAPGPSPTPSPGSSSTATATAKHPAGAKEVLDEAAVGFRSPRVEQDGGGEWAAGAERERVSQERPSWDVMINYFIVVPICALMIGFISWIVATYSFSPAFTKGSTVELASTAVVWAYTLFTALTQTAVVLKRLFALRRGGAPPQNRRGRGQFVENPFNRGGRGASEARGGAEPGREREEREGSPEPAPPKLGWRKVSVASLASSVGSRWGGSSAPSSGLADEDEKGLRVDEKAAGERRGSAQSAYRYYPSTTAARPHGGGLSLMAGVQQVMPPSAEEAEGEKHEAEAQGSEERL
ncbi:hypothetical protein JCM10207_007975 [Rhodosporidiobolus poonsookiae]